MQLGANTGSPTEGGLAYVPPWAGEKGSRVFCCLPCTSHDNFSGLKENKNKTNKNPLELNDLSEQKLTPNNNFNYKRQRKYSIQSQLKVKPPPVSQSVTNTVLNTNHSPSFTVAMD